MNYILNYQQFKLNENLNSSEGITNDSVPFFKKNISKNLTQLLRVSKKDISFVGSSGKGLKEELCSNINICIDKNKLMKENKLEQKDIKEFVEKQFKRLGNDFKYDEEEETIIVTWPSKSRMKSGIVEAVIHLTEHVDWMNFSRYSPDINEGSSKYKGKYREALLKAIVECKKQEIIAYFDEKDSVKEYTEYEFSRKKGLYSVTKSFEGKNGVLLKPIILESSKKKITDKPEEFVKIIFGEDAIAENFMTFEQCLEEIKTNKKFSKSKNKIIEKFKKNIIGMRLVVPEGLM